MSFIETQAVRVVLVVIVVAAVFTGMTFAGIAGFLALNPYMHPAWAALIVAAALIVPVLIGAVILRNQVAQPRPKPAPVAATPDQAAMAMIAGMAKDKPLLAVLFAGLLGAAGTILQHKGRVE